MSIVILNYRKNGIERYCDWLSEAGDSLYLISAFPTNDSRFHEVRVIDDYKVSSAVEKAVLEIHEHDKIRFLIALSECDIARAARLRKSLGLPGQWPQSAIPFRDKVVMKDLARARVEVPRYAIVDHYEDILTFVTEQGFPVVLKPRSGVGSVNTFKLSDYGDLEAVIQKPLQGSIIEEYIDGGMYQIDGFYADGAIRALAVGENSSNCLDILSGLDSFVSYLSEENSLYPRFQRFIVDLLDALPLPASFAFHCEVFRRKDGSLVLCEIASRVGGGRVARAVECMFGVDLDEWTVRSQTGQRVVYPTKMRQVQLSAVYFLEKRPGRLEAIPEALNFPFVNEYRAAASVGDRLTLPSSSTDALATVVVTGSSEVELGINLTTVAQVFESTVKISG